MIHHLLRPFFLPAVSLFILLSLAGCGPAPDSSGTPLVYRLKWLYNMSVVGDLYTLEHSFFAQEGLEVDIRPGGPERDAIKELEIGRAHFGVASADQVIRAVAKGSPVVVLAQLFQANPLQWIHRAGQNLQTPADLKNRVIGITYGGNDESIMRALLAKHRIREDKVEFFSVRYDYTPFYQGKVDLWPVYQNAEGLIISEKLAQAGEEADFFNPNEFGIRFVANSIITTEQMVREHPETVSKFTRAILRGWRQSLDPANADRAVATVQRFDRDTSVSLLSKQLDATRTLMMPPSGKDFGWIDSHAWKQTAGIMFEQKLIATPVSVDEILLSRVN
ncbi:MAG: ABC transporter substrate-binding protein [Thermodesulfobacteriota bacterium]|nr:ABC transporter substrate-binding protein [Thermodesulfobacteriota bacterium]